MPNDAAFAVNGVAAEWDEATRILRIVYARGWVPTPGAARELQARVRAWVGEVAPYDMLVDAEGLARVNLLWRLDWTSFMRQHRGRVRIAAYHVPSELDSLIFAFSWATGLPVRTFAEEDRAFAWLRGSGDARRVRATAK